jgi:hypothetical protein
MPCRILADQVCLSGVESRQRQNCIDALDFGPRQLAVLYDSVCGRGAHAGSVRPLPSG